MLLEQWLGVLEWRLHLLVEVWNWLLDLEFDIHGPWLLNPERLVDLFLILTAQFTSLPFLASIFEITRFSLIFKHSRAFTAFHFLD